MTVNFKQPSISDLCNQTLANYSFGDMDYYVVDGDPILFISGYDFFLP